MIIDRVEHRTCFPNRDAAWIHGQGRLDNDPAGPRYPLIFGQVSRLDDSLWAASAWLPPGTNGRPGRRLEELGLFPSRRAATKAILAACQKAASAAAGDDGPPPRRQRPGSVG